MEIIAFIIAFIYFICELFDQNRRPQKKKEKRPRRPAFKKLYDLNRVQPIEEFERKMIEGMLKEDKEVFVTAFCDSYRVLKVTASRGSKFSCRPSDNYYKWADIARKVGATEIRQYHSHPPVFGRSFISRQDRESHKFFASLLKPSGIKFRSFVVYPSRLGGAKIKEFS